MAIYIIMPAWRTGKHKPECTSQFVNVMYSDTISLQLIIRKSLFVIANSELRGTFNLPGPCRTGLPRPGRFCWLFLVETHGRASLQEIISTIPLVTSNHLFPMQQASGLVVLLPFVWPLPCAPASCEVAWRILTVSHPLVSPIRPLAPHSSTIQIYLIPYIVSNNNP